MVCSGYMAPEYVMRGQYSAKSDIFSYGVLVLEILTGRKNSNFLESEQAEDLLSYVSTGGILILLNSFHVMI